VTDLRSAIEQGHYARKQILSRDRLVAWSHARRFETAVELARAFGGKKMLDYGCGDGTFLALTMMMPDAPSLAVGAELSSDAIDDCRLRYSDEPRLQFVRVGELDGRNHAGQYDAVFCMEVFEHVVDWEPELARLERLLAPDGTLIISVPVETGLPLLVKQTVRRIAGWRGIGHYPGTTSYSLRELAAGVVAGATQHVVRPVFNAGDGPFYDHKGFNWMALKSRLQTQFEIARIVSSPFSWLGPHLATQVWFVLNIRRRVAASRPGEAGQ
jgi:SAM-dependent methyltransferase